MSVRRILPRPQGSLEAVTTALIDACGGEREVEASVRVEKSTLHRYTSPNHPHHMPVDVVRACEMKCGQPILTRFLAAELGFALIDLKDGAREGTGNLIELAENFSKVVQRMELARADGMVDPEEARQIAADLYALVQTAMNERMLFRQLAAIDPAEG
ncbi:MAG: hypothetical protein Alpg2KO_14390 [Alphaproteobacteria bacterium]